MMKRQQNTVENPWSILSRENAPCYEMYVLAACMKSEALWNKLSTALCVRDRGDRIVEVNDFTSPEAYLVFKAVKAFHNASPAFCAPPLSALGGLMETTAVATRGGSMVVTQQRRQDAIALCIKALQISEEMACMVVGETWRNWLYAVQVNSSLADINRAGRTADLAEKVRGLDDIRNRIDAASDGSEDGLHSLAGLYATADREVERIPLGATFSGLNACLGGGFGKGEHVLAVVPSGGGKTVLSCQLATEVAQSGRHVLLISTEQRPDELLPRIFSSMSYAMASCKEHMIEFSKVKDRSLKNMRNELNAGQLAITDRVLESLGGLIHIDRWDSTQASVDYVERRLNHFNRLLEKAGENGIEMLILDWIGSTIKPGPNEDLRILMNRAAESMFRMAEKYNIACLSTCQTNDEGRKVRKVNASHIAEAKGMIQTATAAFGISAVPAKNDGADVTDGSTVYSTKQIVNVFKARKGEAKYFETERNFVYQRFNKM